MFGASPWHRMRRGTILLGLALVVLPLAHLKAVREVIDGLPDPLDRPGTYALAIGLLGALHVAVAINPAPGRGRGPDLR